MQAKEKMPCVVATTQGISQISLFDEKISNGQGNCTVTTLGSQQNSTSDLRLSTTSTIGISKITRTCTRCWRGVKQAHWRLKFGAHLPVSGQWFPVCKNCYERLHAETVRRLRG